MTRNSEIRALASLAGAKGWTVEQTGRNHLRLTAPDGSWTVRPGTPGGRRSMANVRARLRRMGLRNLVIPR